MCAKQRRLQTCIPHTILPMDNTLEAGTATPMFGGGQTRQTSECRMHPWQL